SFNDLAPRCVFVAETEATHRCVLTRFQRDQETPVGKIAQPELCHQRRAHQSYAGRPRPCIAASATLAGCDAVAPERRYGLRQLRRPAERPAPAGWPTPASLQALGGEGTASSYAGQRALAHPRTRAASWFSSGHNVCELPGAANRPSAAEPLAPTSSREGK